MYVRGAILGFTCGIISVVHVRLDVILVLVQLGADRA